MAVEQERLLRECVIMSHPATCVVCGQLAPLICSACKSVSYCAKEHQKHHWPEHKHQCRPFEVRTSKELGRYLAAKRDILAGEVLYKEAPTVVGPKLVEPSPVCLGCLKSPGTACCEGCGWPVCSPACPGLRDPHCHAVECKILSLAPVSHSQQCRYECILPLRCLLMQRRNPRKWKIIMSMESHMDKRGPSTEVYKELQENVVDYLIRNYLLKLDDNVIGDMSASIIHRICGAIDVNALEIQEGQVEILALLPTAFIMCHSCIPNTKHTFKDTRITVQAAVNIAKNEDITTMYTHMLWTTQARKEHLLNTKYFSCQCPRCADPTELGTHISALRCLAETSQGAPCGGFQYPKEPLDGGSDWFCNKCSTSLASLEVCELISCLDLEVENIQLNQPTVERLEDLLGKLETVLHPNHYLCYKIKHSLIQLYGHQQGYLHRDLNQQALIRKAAMCRDLTSVTDKIDPGHGRLGLYSAVLLYELHCALMELYVRNKHVTLLHEAKAALEEEIKFLPTEESDNSLEYKMRELAKKSLIDVDRAISASKDIN